MTYEGQYFFLGLFLGLVLGSVSVGLFWLMHHLNGKE